MRSILTLAVAALAVGALAPTAGATCMEHGTKWGGVRFVSCAPPGGPVTSWVCYHDHCVQMPGLPGDGGGGPGGDA